MLILSYPDTSSSHNSAPNTHSFASFSPERTFDQNLFFFLHITEIRFTCYKIRLENPKDLDHV